MTLKTNSIEISSYDNLNAMGELVNLDPKFVFFEHRLVPGEEESHKKSTGLLP